MGGVTPGGRMEKFSLVLWPSRRVNTTREREAGFFLPHLLSCRGSSVPFLVFWGVVLRAVCGQQPCSFFSGPSRRYPWPPCGLSFGWVQQVKIVPHRSYSYITYHAYLPMSLPLPLPPV